MKLLGIVVYHKGSEAESKCLGFALDLTNFSWFARKTIQEHILFASTTSIDRTPLGVRQTVGMKDNPYLLHCSARMDGLAGVAISDEEYPTRAIHSMLTCLMEEVRFTDQKNSEEEKNCNWSTNLAEWLRKYQQPEEADKILKIQKTLQETQEIMHKNIEELMRRGESLDDLVTRSNELSSASKDFYRGAKRANSCCKYY